MNFITLIKSDYKKYRKYGSNFIFIVFLTQGFWATFQYRLAHAVYISTRNKIIRTGLMLPFMLWQKLIEILTGISIPASAIIGHSFYIGHFGGVILNAKTIIGNNCNISQGVTIGVSGVDSNRGTPVIGDNVYIGVNSAVVGKINVGNNVLVGACSLVNRDIPNNAVVVGVPARIVSNRSSQGYI
jgi:serine O-acetyltransferase